MSGKGANPDALADAGYTRGGITKGSVGAGMMSHADTSGSGKDVVSHLQSHGAKQQGFSGSSLSRGYLDDAGLKPSGVEKGSPGADMMSRVDKSGTGEGMKASLQSTGAKMK